MPSTAIRHIFYKPDTQELSVWFNPDGRRYKFFGVPADLAARFTSAPSRGQFFNTDIRGKFDSTLADVAPKQLRRWQAIRSAS